MKTSPALSMEEELRRLMEEHHKPLQPQETVQSAASPYRNIYVISTVSLLLAFGILLSLIPLSPSSESSCKCSSLRHLGELFFKLISRSNSNTTPRMEDVVSQCPTEICCGCSMSHSPAIAAWLEYDTLR